MICALCEQADSLCGEAPQKCASSFIDVRNVTKNEIYCLAIPHRPFATRLKQFDALHGKRAGNSETCLLFMEVLI